MITRLRRISPLAYRVTAVVAVVTVVLFVLAVHSIDQRQRALLQTETEQAAAATSSMLSNVTSVLDSLAATTTASNGSPAVFLTQANALVHAPLSAALVKAYLSRYVVFAAVGPAFRVDQVLASPALTQLHPGGALVDTGTVVHEGDQSTATFAVGPPLVPGGNAIFLQFSVDPFDNSLVGGPAFSDLNAALYGSSHPAPSNLLAATSARLAGSGAVASEPVKVGNSNWTLLAGARHSLVGWSGVVAPLLLLILGLLLALGAGGAVEIIVRRRATSEPGAGSRPTPLDATSTSVQTLPTPSDTPGQPTTDSPRPPLIVTEPDVRVPLASLGPCGPESSDAEPAGETRPEPSFYADWRPDPFGRFDLRRFFLGSPTSLVRDGSIEHYDPVLPTDTIPAQDTDLSETHVVGEQRPFSSNDHAGSTVGEEVTSHGTAAAEEGADPEGTTESETHQALEMVAARVAEAIAEELDNLRAVTSALHDSLPEPSGSDALGSEQPPQPTLPRPPRPAPPPPAVPMPPPPPKPSWPPTPSPPPSQPPPTTTAEETQGTRSDGARVPDHDRQQDNSAQEQGDVAHSTSGVLRRLRKSYRRL
jgi:hypothetical protein